MAKGKRDHRRGGTHRVKDEDRTWTHWDGKTYEELKYAAKERPGLYRKDMKKVEIAKALAADDKGLETEYNKQKRENEKKIAALKKKAAEKQQEQKRLRNLVVEKQEGRARSKVAGYTDEEAQDTILDLEPLRNSNYDTKIAGELLSDEDEWDETSASEAPMSASISPIYPYQKLRIFEWPYPAMPARAPPQPKYPRSVNMDKNDITDEALPKKIPYAVMDLVTTISEEKVELPGRRYPESVGPDFVPRVLQHTIDCARNGVMIGSLRKVIIERGVDWAKRTRIQGWNARMYFYLPPRSSSVSLSDVYTKWNKSAQVVDPSTGRVVKRRPKKQTDKKKDQRQKTLEILAASEWRPPICYLPAYLEYTEPKEKIERANNVENLFYIRFPGMDLPHFYFWADEEWGDPTVPNPEWLDAKLEDEEDERQEVLQRKKIKKDQHTRQCDRYSIYNPFLNLDQARTRVKKSKPPRKFQSPQKPLKGSKYKVALWNIERDLYQNGFAVTLYKYRRQWLAEGKRQDWELLSKNLPELYPSGKLPDAPPVHRHDVSSKSLAEKIAAVEVPSNDRRISPIYGDEPWTRDDDAYWSIIYIPSAVSSPEALHRPKDLDFGKPSVLSSPVLRRRSKASSHEADSPPSWLSSFAPAYEPTGEQVHIPKREEWEDLFSGLIRNYEGYKQEVDTTCPFCGMEWGDLESRWKAGHIHRHGVVGYDIPSQRRESIVPRTSVTSMSPYSLLSNARRSSCRLSTIQILSSPRKTSKVTFSPQIVERRIAYNDQHDDTGGDGDVDSVATASPRRSNLRKGPAKKTTKKSDLKIDTGTKVTKRLSNVEGKGKVGAEKLNLTSSTPSDHITSPELHSVLRYSGEHFEAALDPNGCSTSESDHVPSLYLHRSSSCPDGQSEASSGPSKARSSYESLAYDTRSRGKATKEKVIAKCATKSKAIGKPASTGLGAEVGDMSQALGPESEGKDLRHTWKASRSSLTRRQKALQSLDLDIIEVPKTKGKRKAVDFDPDIPAPDSRTKPSKRAKLSILTSTTRKPSASSTLHSVKRRESNIPDHFTDIPKVETGKKAKGKAVTFEVEEATERVSEITKKNPRTRLLTTPRRSSADSTPHPDRKRQSNALYRWDSDLDSPSGWANGNHTHFSNKRSDEEVSRRLIGSYIATSPAKKSSKSSNCAAISTAESTTLKSKATKVKKTTAKQTALLAKNATAETKLAERRAIRKPTIFTKTTLSGRPFVEPLALAPAQKWTKPRIVSPPSTSRSTSKPSRNPLPPDPPTPSTARYIRSGAPTPSPSIMHAVRKLSTPTTPAVASRSKNKLPPALTPTPKSKSSATSGRMVRRCGVARIKVPGVVRGRTGLG